MKKEILSGLTVGRPKHVKLLHYLAEQSQSLAEPHGPCKGLRAPEPAKQSLKNRSQDLFHPLPPGIRRICESRAMPVAPARNICLSCTWPPGPSKDLRTPIRPSALPSLGQKQWNSRTGPSLLIFLRTKQPRNCHMDVSHLFDSPEWAPHLRASCSTLGYLSVCPPPFLIGLGVLILP